MNSGLKFLLSLWKIVVIILYFIVSVICTLFIVFHSAIVIVTSLFIENGFDFQIVFFAFLSTALIIGLWSLIFMKIKPLLKITFLIILLTILANYINISKLIPSVRRAIDMELCADMDICPEGIQKKNNEGVLFEINKENCIKYGYEWNDKRRDCNLRK